MKSSTLFIGAGWIVFLAALLSSPVLTAVHAFLRLFTEGNAYAKSIAFLFFVLLALSLNASGFLKGFKRDLAPAVALVAVAGLAYSLFLNVAFLSENGFGINSHASHVTDCGSNWCWEATFLQHNHVSKSALFFVEKNFGLSLAGNVDNGKPIYEVVPWADVAAPLTLLFVTALGLLGLFASSTQEKLSRSLFLAAASFLALIAVLDGGIFTVTGINAVALFAIVFLFGEKHNAFEKLAFPLFAASFVAFVPNLFGSYLVFADWFAPVLLASSFFVFLEEKNGKTRLFLLFVLMFSFWNYSQVFLESYSGGLTSIYRASQLNPQLPSSPTLVIYGLAPQESAEGVLLKMPELEFSRYEKHGWYFAGLVSKKNAEISTLALQQRLRQDYPSGYLYVDMNRNSQEFRKVNVFWIKRPLGNFSFDTLSFKVFSVSESAGATSVSGVASASGPALALEIGSAIKNAGGNALVETLVV